MIHEKIKLHVPGSADYAAMYTYFLDLSKEVPIEKRPTVIVCPGGAYAFTSDREAEPIAMRFNAIGMNSFGPIPLPRRASRLPFWKSPPP